MLQQFPGIARRYARCCEYMEAEYKITPLYGLFWNFCLNWNDEKDDLKMVNCSPHVDSKNLAIGVCAIFIYGEDAYSSPHCC